MVNQSILIDYNLSDWNSVPRYYHFLYYSLIYYINKFANHNFNDLNLNFFTLLTNQITIIDLINIILFSIGITFLRQILIKYLFKPLGNFLKISKSNYVQLSESGWRFLFYLCSWLYLTYLLFFNGCCPYFHMPTLAWKDYSLSSVISREIYLIYMIQMGYYIHSVYSSLYIDVWLKDSPLIITHHIVCILSLLFTLITRCDRPSILCMFLSDGCDIFLEGAKLTRCIRVQNGKFIVWIDNLTNILFAGLMIIWFLFRLYWLPLKVIWIYISYVDVNEINAPLKLVFNIFLWVLYAMNVYWFTLILNVFYKVLTGQIKELKDLREINQQKENNQVKIHEEKQE